VWLVVCSRSDAPALWAAGRLQAFGRPVEVLYTEDLDAPGVRFSHRVDRRSASTRIVLADGRAIDSGRVSSVLNRMLIPPLDVLRRALPGDVTYARSELVAFTMSWLRALAPVVVNDPACRGLSGAWRSPLEWRSLARRAGLATTPVTAGTGRPGAAAETAMPVTDVLVVGDETFGAPADERLRRGAARLARLAETPIIGLSFAPGTRRLASVTPHPDLSRGGDPGAHAIERLLAA
jgi:hypothetical protein